MGVQIHRLWPRRPRDGQISLGLSCDEEGLCLASYHRLVTAALDREGRRFYRAQPLGEINAALSAGYGTAVNAAPLYPAITRIAEYMTRGEWTLATLAAVHLGLPELPDQTAAHRLLKTTTTAWDPAKHPRWPAQSTEGEGGQFRPADGGDGSLLIPVGSHLLPGGRANLQPGRYRQDLAALMEEIANARPEDVADLRRAIDAKFLRVGDVYGDRALQGILTQASELPPSHPMRQAILDSISGFARGNPENAAAFERGFMEILGGMAGAASGIDSPIPVTPIVPPSFPDQGPPDSRSIYKKGREVADALRDAQQSGDAAAFQKIAEAAQKASYLSREYPKIMSDLDPPKSYEELKAASDEPSRPGYHDHHIVEQGSQNSDVDPSRLQNDDNIVRIPEYKHIEINRYYQTPNDDFGGLTPREYLKGKSYQEKLDCGLDVLRKFGVMK